MPTSNSVHRGRVLARNLQGVLVGFAFVVVGTIAVDAHIADQRAAQAERSTDPPSPGSPEWFVARHDCWTRTAPPDVKLPGHVVVSRDGRTWYAGPRTVGLALDQIFGGVDHELTVHAFCR